MTHKQNRVVSSLLGQVAVILLPVFFFACGGVYTYHKAGRLTATVAMIPLVCGAVFLAALAGWWWLRPNRSVAGLGRWVWKQRWLWLLLVLSLLLRLPSWGTPPQDDGLEYYQALYNACKNFRFDFSYIFQNFRLANHPTWGMALMAAIPEFFMPGNYNSFWVFHTIIALVAIAASYDLLMRHEGMRPGAAFLGALAVGGTPIFLGLTPHISVEPALGAFFLCMVWSYGREKGLLLIFTCALTALSKELGIVLVAGFVGGVILAELVGQHHKNLWQRICIVLRKPINAMIVALCLVGGLFVLWYLFNPDGWAIRALNGENSILQIRIDPPYIVEKGKEYLLTNFDWALILLCLASLALRAAGKGGKAPLPSYLGGVLVAIVLFQVVSVLAVTFTITRYNLAPELALSFLCVSVLCIILQGRLRVCVLGALSLLLTVQGYLTIDPVMKAVYPAVDTGALPMVRVKTDDHERHMSHYVIYNNQYSYLYKGMREIFRTCPPEDYDLIILGRDGFLYLQGYLWDVNKYDFAAQSDSNIVPISSFETDTSFAQAQQTGELKQHAILMYSPTYAEETPTPEQARAKIPDCYTNVQQHELSCGPAGTILYFTADLAGA